MKGKFAVFIFLLYLVLFDSIPLFSQGLKEIPIESSPIFDFVRIMENRLKNIYQVLFFEINFHELQEQDKEAMIELLSKGDYKTCVNPPKKLEDFCSFAKNLDNLSYFESNEFSDSLLIEMKKLIKSIASIKNGEFDRAYKFFNEISEESIKIFFRDLEFFLKETDINKIIDSKRFDIETKRAVLYRVVSDNLDLLNDRVRSYLRDYYDFLFAKSHFKKGSFSQAGKFFIDSSKNDLLKEIAIYNAVISYILDGNFTVASNLIPQLKKDDANMLAILISLFYNPRSIPMYSNLLSNPDFRFLFKHIVKYKMERDEDISFFKGIKMTDIEDDEELLFYFCLNAFLIDKHGSNQSSCKNYSWTVKEYSEFFKDISDSSLNRKDTLKIIEKYKLYHHFPYSKLYADYLFRNNNLEKAKNIYEEILRIERNLKSSYLMDIYLSLSKIFRLKKSYYSARKVIEEAIFKLDDKKDYLRLEQLKIFFEEGQFEEVLWRAKAYLNETENEEIKKELQKFIEMCYEQLNKLKKGRVNGTVFY